MAEGANKRKLNSESLSPEVNQAKKHQAGSSPENRRERFESLPGERCPHCSENCVSESKAVQCDLCGVWAHAECEGISVELYDKFNAVCANVNNVSYYCEANHCNSRIKQLVHAHYSNLDQQVDLPSLRALQVEQANLHRIISEVSNKVDNLNLRNKELLGEIEAASESISTDKPPIIPSESPASTFLTVAEELDNRERRKNNVIIYNLPETSLSQDEKWFTDLCKGVFDISIKITKILRLGKSVENKARPLLIVIDDLSHKEFVVSHSYYLRRHSQYKNVYISTDMTKLQREKHRKLVQELKQRREGGEKNLIIYNGGIVPRRYRNATNASNVPPVGEVKSS